MPAKYEAILDELIAEAVRLDASALEVEYDEGFEEVVVFRGVTGWGMRQLRSSSPEAVALREQLYRLRRKRHRVTIGGCTFDLKVTVRDSFGEDAFRVEFRRI
jgi:hypothetical protein